MGINSQQAKVIIMNEYLFQKKCLGAFTESLQNSDVLAVTKAKYTVEIEVKTHREDLLNEMHTIRVALDGGGKARIGLRQRAVKYYKHDNYLHYDDMVERYGMKSLTSIPFVPNTYYIAMPKELYDHRLNFLTATPYGIILLGENAVFEVIREARQIHKNKIDDDHLMQLMRKTCTENYFLRKKLLEGGDNNETAILNHGQADSPIPATGWNDDDSVQSRD